MKQLIRYSLIVVALAFASCKDDVNTEHVRVDVAESTHPNDIYARENFTKVYNSRIVWRRDEINSDIDKFVVPPYEELVIPMMKVLQEFWIGPFNTTPEGKALVDQLFPPEIVMLGSGQYNVEAGTITLGIAEGGVRITLTQVNEYDMTDADWLQQQLRTILHEFAHITHQSKSLPDGWKDISSNRTGTNWVNISDAQAITMGYVSPYASSSAAEDFADFVGIFLATPKEEFEANYLSLEDCYGLTDAEEIEACLERQVGITILNEKYDVVVSYYNEKFGIDILALRDEIESRIAAVTE
ncbi:MAG: substrate import-associated zinc metallohydrolase lipoprotein [Mangrovibacterium sp.]